ncbi:MAG: RsmB/NOP family class I SAM-dependent RNA methyltransferase [Candidatus Dojkabacteria bacterium]|nr:RsmB/NOP family class I SAM-dependent RNA methyltransferase [Candidatus Dojkabacteria bacterium]
MRKGLRGNYKKPRNFVPNKKDRFYTKEDIFVSRIASILLIPKNKVNGIFSQRAITTIRLNPLKGDTEDTKKSLIGKGYELQEVSGVKDTYFVLNRDKSEISQTQEYVDGKFYIQNLSSILATLVLDPKENEKILDMCAAPGSKTTHISALMNNTGQIIANDSEISRVSALRNVLEQFGVKNAKATLSDANDFGKKYPEYFDRVLLDAPCSGEGMIYMQGTKPLRFWGIDKIKRCSYLQKDLILSAFRALKEGGTLVYSTCTLEPEENEGVVSYLLEHYPNAIVEDTGLKFDKGITKWSGNIYDPKVRNSTRIVPSSKNMGFYIARIKKV